MKTSANKPAPKRRKISLWLKIPLSLLALLVVAIMVIGVLFQIYFYAVPTGKVTDHVFAINDGGFVNLFLIQDGQTWVAVDSAQNPSSVTKGLKKLHVRPDQVSAVLLTHSDYDHAGGLTALPKAKIFISDKEEPMITGKIQRQPGFYNRPLPRPYTLVHDGEVLQFGRVKVRAIAVPGHTPGSTAYVVDDAMLFTGDTLALTRDGKARPFYWIYNMDGKTERASIRKLARLKGLRWIFNDHTGVSNDPAGAFKGW